MRNKINKYDIVLIVCIIVVNILILIHGAFNTVDKGEKVACIYSDSKLVGKYTLTENYETEFKVEFESGYNIVHIQDGAVWIQDATCPDKICMHQDKISKDGEIIVCLPNRLMIQIEDNSEAGDEMDIIVK